MTMPRVKHVLLKLSGEVLMGDQPYGIDPATVGTAGATTRVVGTRAPEPRAATRVVREEPEEAARQVVALLAERRLI